MTCERSQSRRDVIEAAQALSQLGGPDRLECASPDLGAPRPGPLRRRVVVGAGLALFAVLLLRHHLAALSSLLGVYARWPGVIDSLAITPERDDGFDLSFARYNASDRDAPAARIPRVMHHIFLGHDVGALPADWVAARRSCLDVHPASAGWRHMLWDDTLARDLLTEHYPGALDTFDGYPYLIQRADALRYFVLHHHGGVFLDFDLECRRPLDPLVRFPTVFAAAKPAGVGNSLLMAEPRHPLLDHMLDALGDFDRAWPFKYMRVMVRRLRAPRE